MNVNQESGRDIFDSVFVGREDALGWLADHARRGRWEPVVIFGPPGIGKSALLSYFSVSGRARSRLQIWTLPDDPGEAAIFIRVRLGELSTSNELPRIIGIDNADPLTGEAIHKIVAQILNLKAIESVIVARRYALERNLSSRQYELPPLTFEEGEEFIRRSLHMKLSALETTKMIGAANGNPGALILLYQLTVGRSDGEIEKIFRGQLYGDGQALIVPDKKLITTARSRIISTNEALIEGLRRKPDNLYDLDPRKFEEVIAALMEDMGYDVELTPRSRDGGKDILASMETEHGKMLCLVEAKRYSIDNPIKVGLVRQLYGTLCDHNASSAMLVTTSRFTRGANEFQMRNEYRLALRDYGNIVQWLSGYPKARRTG